MNKLTLVAITGSLALGVAPVFGQTNTNAPANPNTGTQWNTERNTATAQRDTTMTNTQSKHFNGDVVRSDKILGATVYDATGKDIGKIRDVVFDENKGDTTRAILAVGDYLGIGSDRLTPVEWNKISVKRENDENIRFTLTPNKAQLQKEQSFSEDNWPDFKNGWKGENIGDKKLVRMSEANSAELFDQSGNQIGNVKDLMLDTQNGKVAYAVVSFSDDYIDKGNRMTMIPWLLVRQSKADTPGYVLHAKKAQLENASYFEANTWPNVNDFAWNKGIYDHYSVTPYYWTGS